MSFGPTSVRGRLTLWYAAVLAVPLCLFAAGSHYLLETVLSERADWFLGEARSSFIAELDVELSDTPMPRAVRSAMRDVRFRDITFFVYGAHDSLIAASNDSESVLHPAVVNEPLPIDPKRILTGTGRGRQTPAFSTVSTDEGQVRVLAGTPILHRKPLTIVAAQSRDGITAVLVRETIASLIAIPFFLVLAAAGGYLLARGALTPVALMSRQARAISATNLHERVVVPNARDELHELATMVNELLERLERSFDQQRRFVANASHELRTPVAIVRAESEVALSREARSEPEYRDTLRVVHDAADRLSRIVHDLFLLARADSGHVPVRSEPLYLDEMAADVARSMRAVASQSGIRIETCTMEESPFVGDVELLGRMLLNLLDNAVKYSEAGTVVRVGLARANDSYRLSVVDQGCGIPAELQSRVFERFFRVDHARERSDGTSTTGAGLGLAIVELVAQAHGGRAELTRSNGTGSEFTVSLPVHPGPT